MLAVIFVRMLIVVLVGPSMWMGVTQGAMTVQVAYYKLIGGGGHGLSR
jgi:hypothetical protein